MATHTGSEGVVYSSSNQISEIRSYTLTESADTLENTTMGLSARTYVASLSNFTGSMDLYWDENDAGQDDLTVKSTITFNVYPEGNTTGDTYYTGSAIITERVITGSFDGLVELSISLQGTGALTQATVA
jgi:hypothetical protein